MTRYEQFYVGGQWVQTGGQEALPVHNPYMEALQAQLVACSLGDVDQAVQSAKAAFPAWSATSPAERKRHMVALHAALEKRTEAFIQAMVDELGVPRWVGANMQVGMPLRNLLGSISAMEQIVWQETIGNSEVTRVPVGVVAAITPWNFPLHQIVAKIAGTLGAGCTAVLKPSESAPGVAQLFMEAVHEAGVPPGVVNMVWGGAEIGAQLSTHPDIDLISFTGSESVARRIMVDAASTLKQTAFELGGKSAAVILPGADLDTAIPAVFRSCMINSGQTCVAQSRLIVSHDKLAEVLERLTSLAASPEWQGGDPADPATRFGPLATPSHYQRVIQHIERAVKQGANLVTGGSRLPLGRERGYFVSPTVLSDVTTDMDIAQQEVFGPVLAVMSYRTLKGCIDIANSTPYGLSGAIWAADTAQGRKVASQLRTGQISVNGGPQNLEAPFGGFGLSGYGRENGRFGIEAFLSYQSLQLPVG